MSFQSWTVSHLKDFLKLKGITVASGVNKSQLIRLCHCSQTLPDDPDQQQCNTTKIIHRKLCSAGITSDPFSLQYISNFSANDIPAFGLVDIFNYLLFSRADYDNKKLKAYKSFDDYRLFEDGHVQGLSLHIAKEHYIFLASVLPTCRKATFLQKPSYKCWFILNKEGEVFTAFCECMGG